MHTFKLDPLLKRVFFLYTFHVNDSDGNVHKHILYIPGTSGLKDMARIESLHQSSRNRGYGFSYLQTWADEFDLQSATLSRIFDSIDENIASLAKEREIFLVGKSFGGGIMLLRTWPKISKMVLWAPAVELSDSNSYEALKDTKLENLPSLSDITTNVETLQHISTPTLVIHGTDDTVVQLSTLQLFIKNLPSGTLQEIPGMGHSPQTESELEFLVANTLDFFT